MRIFCLWTASIPLLYGIVLKLMAMLSSSGPFEYEQRHLDLVAGSYSN